ncbi:MAG: CRISPR-associated protein Cas4 [Desulfurococcaceae archaeon]
MISIKPIDKLNPTLVKQYAYCPVIVWIKSMFLIEEPVTDSMFSGGENVKTPNGVGQYFIKTKNGSTIIDELLREKDGSLTIIERKAYRSYNYSRYVEQAVSSYIIARETIPKIRRVKLEIQNKMSVIELNDDLIKEVEKIFEKTKEIIGSEKTPPKPNDMKKCISCWYRRFCPYW